MRKSLLKPNKKLNVRLMKMFSLLYKIHKFCGIFDIHLSIVTSFLIKGRLFWEERDHFDIASSSLTVYNAPKLYGIFNEALSFLTLLFLF